MGLSSWSEAELEYGREILNSGLEGVRTGQQRYLRGRSMAGVLGESVRNSCGGAAAGACIGILGSCAGTRRKSIGRTVALSILGGLVGFGVSMIWENRQLTISAAQGASENIGRLRDERWMKKHSIAYA